MTARPIAFVLSGTLLLSSLVPLPAVAQDNDQIYAVIRRDAEMRAARRGEAPPSARGFSFPGLPFFGSRREVPEITVNPRTGAIDPVTGQPLATPRTTLTTPGGQAYCVRTCDGFYFPVGRPMARAGRVAQQDICQRQCPGAEVALYSAGGNASIEQAVGPRGQTYAALSTAFRFRERVDAACTCAGASTNGLARVPITHDPTLRAGDVVVTEAGVRVFAGGARFPYRQADFVAARSYGRLPADIRQRVAAIEAGIQARDQGLSAPVSRLGPATRPRAAATGTTTMASSLPLTAGTANAEGIRVLDITRPEASLSR
ncbi:DUF2865 domain-containing protein [Phreatobacter sp.]|uniref:DUF2865 domain-containing protein n=1 Tax=Phreatobacter sp. TaxID=1966341 RepID=UPI003F6EF878